jgi:hypothetical protein
MQGLAGRWGSRSRFALQKVLGLESCQSSQYWFMGGGGRLTENTAYDNAEAAQGAREENCVKAVT